MRSILTGSDGTVTTRGGAPAIIFVTVAFGRDKSSSEGGNPPASWSDMVVSGVRAVEPAASVRGRELGGRGAEAGARAPAEER